MVAGLFCFCIISIRIDWRSWDQLAYAMEESIIAKGGMNVKDAKNSTAYKAVNRGTDILKMTDFVEDWCCHWNYEEPRIIVSLYRCKLS